MIFPLVVSAVVVLKARATGTAALFAKRSLAAMLNITAVTALVIKGNDSSPPISTGTMGVDDTSAVMADAMLFTAACGAAGVVNVVRVKTDDAVVG